MKLYKLPLSLLFCLIWIQSFQSKAQLPIVDSILPGRGSYFKGLTIGDTVIDIKLSLVNHTSSFSSLYEFINNQKFIILDYWATWCSPCLNNFPKLDSMQEKYSKKLQILLINTKSTGDDDRKVEAVFAKIRNPVGEMYQLPSIVDDTLSESLFPHKLLPHYIWIDKEKVVRAITSSDQVTWENVEKFVEGKELYLPIKEDLDYDPRLPLFIKGNGGDNEAYLYRSILTKYIDGLPGSSGIVYNEDKKVFRIYNINSSVLGLYRQAFPMMAKYNSNRVIVKSSNPERYLDNHNWDTWKYKYACSYEMIIPPTTMNHALEIMRDDLKRYFNLKVYIDRKVVKCYVLKKLKGAIVPLEKSDNTETNIWDNDSQPKYFHNRPISQLLNYLNSNTKTPFIDEANFKAHVSMDGLPGNLTDISKLRQALKNYGFDLIERRRKLEFFILEEIDWDVND